MYTKGRHEVKFNEVSFTFSVDQRIGVDTESLHHAVGSRDSTVAHCPHEHVCSFGVQESEVPEVVVSSLSLGNFIMGLGFYKASSDFCYWHTQIGIQYLLAA